MLSELTTNQKGAIAELKIATRAIELGVEVYRPVGEGGRYDMISGLEDRLLRVQCKWAIKRGSVLIVPCYSNRRTREGLRRRIYSPGEIDAYGVYSAELDRCYFLPIDRFVGYSSIQLRLKPSLNNQRARINWAADFQFEATLRASGP